ncbi:MAG: LysE family translocator [Chloroflexota bacterium]
MAVEISLLFRGLLIGFSIAAPVGPIGVLCIRRTLTGGRLVGLVSGLGAASADAVYGSVAGFGLTAISGFLLQQQVWLRLIGGLFLCYLGIKAFLSRTPEEPTEAGGSSLLGAFVSTFVLTLTNPMTILSFAAIFAGLGLIEAQRGFGSAGVLVLGVFAGSALWWLTLAGSVGLFRRRFTPRWLRWVNRVSGVVIFGFGCLALLSLG